MKSIKKRPCFQQSRFYGQMAYNPFAIASAIQDIAAGTSIDCGQCAVQAPHPMQAEGCLSAGSDISAIGAIKPPSE